MGAPVVPPRGPEAGAIVAPAIKLGAPVVGGPAGAEDPG